jgi:MoaA/NifB/PqqE/SkfB family radical SAM enzyme
LYPLIEEKSKDYNFHLNTNAFIAPPSKSVKRLKVSLDSTNGTKWNDIVGRAGAWERVVQNIKEACNDTTVSITFTLSKKTFREAVDFSNFCSKEFPNLYAVFFSVYKGNNPEYELSKEDADEFFSNIYPKLIPTLNIESRSLIEETIDEKRRLMSGTRFEQNIPSGICYLAMSERVVTPTGMVSTCSHLYRDRIIRDTIEKHSKCQYGCNRRLVAFNEEVFKRISR